MKLYIDIDTLKIIRWYNDQNVQIRYACPSFYYGTKVVVTAVLMSNGAVVAPDDACTYVFGGDDSHKIIDKEQVAIYSTADKVVATGNEPYVEFVLDCSTEKLLGMVNGKRAGVSIFTWIAKIDPNDGTPTYVLDDTCQARTTPYVDGVVAPHVENTTYSKAQIDAILQGAFGDYVGRIYEEPGENFPGFSIGEVFLWAGETTENYKCGHFYRIDESEESEGELIIKIATDITAAGGGDVQSDWDENDSDSPAYIRNKPTFPPPQVQSDWDESDSEDVAYIRNKPDVYTQEETDELLEAKVDTTSVGSAGGVASLDSAGKVPEGELPLAGPWNGSSYPVGAVKMGNSGSISGITIGADGGLNISPAPTSLITSRTPGWNSPIVPSNLNYSVTAALTDANKMSLTDAQKASAQDTLGIASPIVASTAPTTSTAGAVGQLYVDTATSKTYTCTAVTVDDTDPQNPVTTYTWTDDINAKGGTFTGTLYVNVNTPSVTINTGINIGIANSGTGAGNVFIGQHNANTNQYCLLIGNNLKTNKTTNTSSRSIWTGYYNVGDDFRVCVGMGSDEDHRKNILELKNNGNHYVAGGHQQGITEIPSATSAYTLAEGCFSHVPSSAPTYTLPDIPQRIVAEGYYYTRNTATDGTGYYGWLAAGTTNRYTASATPSVGDNTYTNTALTSGAKPITAIDRRTHRIDLTVDFTHVQTYSFLDSAGEPIVPLFTPSIAAGDVYTFRMEYSAIKAAWLIYPQKQGAVADDFVMRGEVGASNGVASLDSAGKVPSAELPVATPDNLGGIKTRATYGNQLSASGVLNLVRATNLDIDARTQLYKPIVPNNLNYAVTAALTDANHITLTSSQQAVAQQVLGINNATLAKLEFDTVDGNNEATFHVSLPIAGVMAPSGTYYAVERQDCKIFPNDIITKLNVSRYMAYENMSSFSGTWTAYFAGGLEIEDAEQVGQVLENAVKKKSVVGAVENGEAFVWDAQNDNENALTQNHIYKRADVTTQIVGTEEEVETTAFLDLLETDDEITLDNTRATQTLIPGRSYTLSLAQTTTILIDDLVKDLGNDTQVDLLWGKTADIRLYLTTNNYSIEWKTVSERDAEEQTKIKLLTTLERMFSYIVIIRRSNEKWHVCALEA